MTFELDHIAVAGETLDAAVTHSEEAFGLPLGPGGQHTHYATHNRLLGLEQGLYFEAIAPDPSQPKPDYPRWFGLDDFDGPAQLDKWILRCSDIAEAQAMFPEAGEPVHLTRGDLSWTMLVPPDGRLPFDGQFPAIIQWHTDTPPGTTLQSAGLRLEALTICGPDVADLKSRLAPVFDDDRVLYQTTAGRMMQAVFLTTSGRRILT